ncbi:2-amino-4-hydroxy-6-hydroxymethyldihydropteridine diphosphokinase [Chryseobacterium sp. SSA4.19]|uniref:2-amino-4-hydroxy-6- hydroxymethyldihydropteridine diphosphokinase n=1 Tax=Chryseobacterium sp. SSA4.19 TaxID=2919915 RepID=UPI001F4DC307|nr:2-amino-4-hydroxy-6-hydroxymethyldihydropteridine diphosphokinase [Chryseobacterium sp. SSA4.19]MCJ8152222.1 2-amino-4-hydroxy-6-hydroxymethyldihydropteridine diphosphokinase [Chryseobacterium sp. SSA4.19]
MSQHKAVLLLGSNLGDQKKNVEMALEMLKDGGNEVIRVSEFLMSQPVEFESSNIFCNIATIILTNLSPVQLLDFVKNIEIKMGRLHDSRDGGYTDRIIDIDIITYNGLIFVSKRLEIPHRKHLFERTFSGILLKDFI